MYLLPTGDEPNGCLEIVEGATTDLTREVVSNASARSGLVDDNETTRLADGFGDLAEGHRVDGAEVDKLDRRGGVRGAEPLGKELDEAGRRVAEKLNGANWMSAF